MTQSEIEAEFASLRAQLARLGQEQETKKEEWRRLGLVTLLVALGFLAASVLFGSTDIYFGRSPQPQSFALLYVIAPLVILIRLLGTPFEAKRK
jgi:hypothetical protein